MALPVHLVVKTSNVCNFSSLVLLSGGGTESSGTIKLLSWQVVYKLRQPSESRTEISVEAMLTQGCPGQQLAREALALESETLERERKELEHQRTEFERKQRETRELERQELEWKAIERKQLEDIAQDKQDWVFIDDDS